MERRHIFRGIGCGALAGLVAFLFARIFAEPLIGKAIAYEGGRDEAQEALDKAAGMAIAEHGHDLFSRTIQSNVGLGVGMLAFGAALGGLYAVAYSISYGRIGLVRARTTALLVALGGFLLVYLVPFMKYPANPPAIGHEATIGDRSKLYLAMLGASLIFGILAVWLGRRLRQRYSAWTSTLLAGAAFIVAIGIVMYLLPAIGHLAVNKREFGNHTTETPQPLLDDNGNIVYPGFPADVLFRFRFYSVGAQLILWGVLGLCFGPLAERLLEPGRRNPGAQARKTQSPQINESLATGGVNV
jgi:predicted cobalt transporter CbtA